ncbi:hypothetical protein SCP_0411370 [Sparassis crispa]|uniref:Uncharacterized protein n=1 Tax=Sparassis crispa TaxID=139825 RepID=A0A401GKS7_9APHY|nr:hypothetical protein SCP_0411370 [Sparassis crispa]GBE82752.1 hypothetical protein SCP_0411370 [Sparassis crispa]
MSTFKFPSSEEIIDEDWCIRDRLPRHCGGWERPYSAPFGKLLEHWQARDKGYIGKKETYPRAQDVRFFEPTDPSFWPIVIVSSENVLPESIDDTLKKFSLFVVEEIETPLPDQNITCMGVYVMKDMEKNLTVKGWNKLPEKTKNACIELELQLSWLREHSSSEDVAPMIFSKDTIRKNYDGGVSQLSLLVLERKDFRVKPWESWTVLQKSQNPH